MTRFRRIAGFKANKAKSKGVPCLYWSVGVVFSTKDCLDSIKGPQINPIHFLLIRNVTFGNETNGNDVRRPCRWCGLVRMCYRLFIKTERKKNTRKSSLLWRGLKAC